MADPSRATWRQARAARRGGDSLTAAPAAPWVRPRHLPHTKSRSPCANHVLRSRVAYPVFKLRTPDESCVHAFKIASAIRPKLLTFEGENGRYPLPTLKARTQLENRVRNSGMGHVTWRGNGREDGRLPEQNGSGAAKLVGSRPYERLASAVARRPARKQLQPHAWTAIVPRFDSCLPYARVPRARARQPAI